MPAERGEGFVCLTGAAIVGYRAVVLKHSLQLWLAGIKSHRGAKLKDLLFLATEITSYAYPRTKRGAASAVIDLTQMATVAKDLDTLGADIRATEQYRRS